jgi:hypothetical protein
MTSRTFSSSSSSTNTTTSSSSTTSQIQNLHPLPPASSSIPPPRFSLSDIVFVVGAGDSCREPSEIVDIGYKASEQCYVYDCVPLYNRKLQGLFLCRDSDIRKSKWGLGDALECLGDGKRMRIFEMRYSAGQFCYRVGRLPEEGEDWGESGKGELLLEEEDLVKMVKGRGKENERR